MTSIHEQPQVWYLSVEPSAYILYQRPRIRRLAIIKELTFPNPKSLPKCLLLSHLFLSILLNKNLLLRAGLGAGMDHSLIGDVWLKCTKCQQKTHRVSRKTHRVGYNTHRVGYNAHRVGYNAHRVGCNAHRVGRNKHHVRHNALLISNT